MAQETLFNILLRQPWWVTLLVAVAFFAIAHVVFPPIAPFFALPFVVLVVYARLRNFDFRVVESARDLGASPLRAFFTVTLPIISPTVIGAALIATALSLDDFVITFFTIGKGMTLPTFVFAMIRTTVTPAANAVGTLILMMTIGATLAALWLTRYRG